MWGPFAVVQSLSHVWLFVTPRTTAQQISLSLTISQSLPKFMPISLVMPSSHCILWYPFLLLPSIFPSIRDFSSESAVHIRWPNYWHFSINLSNGYSGLIPLRLTGLISFLSKGLSGVFSGGLRFCQRTQRYYVYLEDEPGPSFMTAPPLFLHSLPSLTGNCLNMPFGAQGRSRRMNEQESGDMKRICNCEGPIGSCLVSILKIEYILMKYKRKCYHLKLVINPLWSKIALIQKYFNNCRPRQFSLHGQKTLLCLTEEIQTTIS